MDLICAWQSASLILQTKKKRSFPQRSPRTVSILGILGQLIVSELRICPSLCQRLFCFRKTVEVGSNLTHHKNINLRNATGKGLICLKFSWEDFMMK
jgi:hypothetical protein